MCENGYSNPPGVVKVYPDPKSYCFSVDCNSDTTDTTSDVILKDILKKYSGAWEKLATFDSEVS